MNFTQFDQISPSARSGEFVQFSQGVNSARVLRLIAWSKSFLKRRASTKANEERGTRNEELGIRKEQKPPMREQSYYVLVPRSSLHFEMFEMKKTSEDKNPR